MEEAKTRVHFGSLEEQERARLDAGQGDDGGLSAAVQAGIEAGNINISRGVHYLEHTSSVQAALRGFWTYTCDSAFANVASTRAICARLQLPRRGAKGSQLMLRDLQVIRNDLTALQTKHGTALNCNVLQKCLRVLNAKTSLDTTGSAHVSE